ncbi:Putative Zn-dependent protease, contains TPR repeats [Litoreibacter ascidiaceicola]|uniref:Putative Zn-dependent protease, contains TPR repeats n=1 Tax=Litoreibacter ascidiaceicola TaxID=1486859 RepID=A0A1M4VLM4_9RHOB|nr:Putative Zn-dependent protease, contains TPR repeats [Litoreibacter ascidiaceicola]
MFRASNQSPPSGSITGRDSVLKLLRHLLLVFVATLTSVPAYSASLIRDAEIEQALQQLAKPVLRSAGFGSGRIRVLVINDPKLNAFVVDANHVFIHSGLIMKLNRPEALQAVIAHELAHIANGHLTRRATNARVAGRVTAIGMALAAAAAIGGNGDAAVGLAAGTSSSAARRFFAHTRAEESSADQSAMRYMGSAGLDPSAMVDILQIFRGQEALRPGRQDPYARTHPLTQDRLRAVKGFAASYKKRSQPTTPEAIYWYARMSAKLNGFLRNPRSVLRRSESKGNGEIATLRRAIAYHKTPNLKKALAEMNALLKMRPRDPYYHELKGQILLEARQFNAAVGSYKQALALAPREPLIESGLGRALLAQGSSGAAKQALTILTRARSRDPGDPQMLRNLALAYAKNGQNAMASVATAERYAVLGRFDDAAIHAKRALGALPRGSSGWLRAQDILASAEAAPKRKKKRK